MDMNKSKYIASKIIILFMFLYFLLIFLPTIIHMIPDTKFKFALGIIVFCLTFIFILYVTYKDIRNKQYVTTKFIVLTDIVMIILFVNSVLVVFKIYDIRYTEMFLDKNDIQLLIVICFAVGAWLKKFLKREQFMNK
jgi:hypothetical protein